MRRLRVRAAFVPPIAALAALATLATAQPALAQSQGDLHLRRLLAVPLGVKEGSVASTP